MSDTIPPDSGRLLSLFGKLSKLNADEIDSIDYLTDKLIAGREKHGPLDLASDRRDWFVEATQELADRQCYEAFAAVQRRRLGAVVNIASVVRSFAGEGNDAA